MKRAVAYAGAFILILTVALGLAYRGLWIEPGLAAEYTSDSAAPGAPRVSRIDAPPFSAALKSAPISTAGAFSVTWTGQLLVPQDGTFVLAINADAGTSLFVDGRAVFDNVRFVDVQFASAAAPLTRGPHAIFISYAHHAGEPRLNFVWTQGVEPLAQVPASSLQPRRASPTRVALAHAVGVFPVVLGWVWAVALGAMCLVALGTAGAAAKRTLAREELWDVMRWILAASLVLNAAGLWWGLPAEWVPIEIAPTYVIQGWSQHFMHGWSDAYPPIHFYVLALALSPFLTLRALAGVDVYGVGGHAAMLVVSRLVSVAGGAGILVAIALTGARAFGKRAGLLAAGIFSLVTPFVFYAKTANVDVPYVFWFAVSLYFYVRAFELLRLRDILLFAAAGMLAIGTKDQAYGLYLLAPVVFIVRLWQAHRDAGERSPLLRALTDARLWTAAALTLVLFGLCFDVPFNYRGFVDHFRFIMGPGSADYRVFDPTPAGRWALLRLTTYLAGISMGWPIFAIAAAGCALALASAKLRPMVLALLAPIVAYYLGFIDVVLYNYDRFMLPVCVILALFAGLAADTIAVRKGGAAALSVALAYTLLYSVTVDVLMIGDGRYAAREWMLARVRADDIVAVTDLPELVPRLDGFRTIGLATVQELARERPRFVVLNADYARAAAPGTAWADLIGALQHGSAGYRLAASFRRGSPWPWLPFAHPDLVGRREETRVFSVLRDINPTTEIFELEGDGQVR